MPRILRIHNRLVVGGPSLNVLYLAKYLAPEFETLVLVGEKEDHEKDASFVAEQMGIKTIKVQDMGRSIHLLRDYQAYKEVKRIIKEFKPDIVHTHAAKPGAVGRLAASSMKVPVIVHTYHGHVFHSYFNKMKTNFFLQTERWLAKKTSKLVVISEQQKKELKDEFRIAAEEKFRIVPLGFELNKFRLEQEMKRKKFRDEFKVKDDEIAIGIVGRLVPVKNHLLFLEGIAHVKKHAEKKIRAFIVGDGETRRTLEDWARHSDISITNTKDFDENATIVFTSWRSDIDYVNAGLDIITLTSLNEGTPVSLIEAQAANKPIVSTRVGGIGDIVIEGDTALLSEVNDHAGFAENLLKIVEQDELRMRLGKKGAEFVTQKFSVERLAGDMASLYKELLGNKTR